MRNEKVRSEHDGVEARSFASCPKVVRFLDQVTEQMEYGPAREPVRQEIGSHIEDLMEDFISSGDSVETAEQKALECMGEPVKLGQELNRVKRPRKDPALVAAVLLCVINGLIISYLSGYRDLNFFSQNFYFVFGIVVLWFVVKKGCGIVMRHSKGLALMYFTAFLLFIVLSRLMHWRYTPAIYNGNFLLPAAALMLVHGTGSKKKAAAAASGFVFSAVLLQIFFGYLSFTLSGLLLVIMDAAAVAVLFLRSDCHADFGCSEKEGCREKEDRFGQAASVGKKFFRAGIVFIVLMISMSAVFGSVLGGKENIFLSFFSPEQDVESVMDDSYNSVLIRSLLERSSWFDPVELSDSEMEAYSTGEWYFGSGAMAEMPHNEYEAGHTELEDILPYHFRNNYMLSYLILRCGRAAGILMSAVICMFYVLLLQRVGRIRSRYGFLLSASSFFLLAGQAVFYLIGNFGYQLGQFCNLPFISEGLASIFVNAVLIGSIMASYRYDNVRDVVFTCKSLSFAKAKANL